MPAAFGASCPGRDTAVIGKHEAPDRLSEPSNLPEVILVEITELADPDARTLGEHIAAFHKFARWPAVIAPALLLAILATALTLPVDRGGGPRVVRATARDSGPSGVAAAYGHPLRCLSITILAAGQRYARAEFNHRNACGRFSGDSTAIFLRVMGAWRPVVKTFGYGRRLQAVNEPQAAASAVSPPVGWTGARAKLISSGTVWSSRAQV
jgi:hypothetical protein